MARFHRETKKEESLFVTDRQNQRQKNNRLLARRGDQHWTGRVAYFRCNRKGSPGVSVPSNSSYGDSCEGRTLAMSTSELELSLSLRCSIFT